MITPAGKGLTHWPSYVMMFPYVFVTLPYGVLGKVRYLIALIPDLCLLNFYEEYKVSTLKLNQGR